MSIFHTDESLISQGKGNTIRLWNISNAGYEKNATDLFTEHLGFCKMECLPDKNLLIAPKQENTISIHSLDDLTEQQTLVPVANEPLGQLMSLKFVNFSGQTYILAAYESGDFLTWDLRCNKVINREKFEDECPLAIDYDPVTNRGLYGGTSDKIGVFSYVRNSMQIVKKMELSIKNPGINCIRIRSDQKVFSTGGWDGRIRIFSWKSLRPLAVLTEHKGAISDICYSDGKIPLWKASIMAGGGMDGQISLWDLYN